MPRFMLPLPSREGREVKATMLNTNLTLPRLKELKSRRALGNNGIDRSQLQDQEQGWLAVTMVSLARCKLKV
jgi:hypothetical protein